jgi:hypothetical protein
MLLFQMKEVRVFHQVKRGKLAVWWNKGRQRVRGGGARGVRGGGARGVRSGIKAIGSPIMTTKTIFIFTTGSVSYHAYAICTLTALTLFSLCLCLCLCVCVQCDRRNTMGPTRGIHRHA